MSWYHAKRRLLLPNVDSLVLPLGLDFAPPVARRRLVALHALKFGFLAAARGGHAPDGVGLPFGGREVCARVTVGPAMLGIVDAPGVLLGAAHARAELVRA